MNKIKKAVIPIAGMGTRFLPITKSVPKEMLPIVDKPTLHYIVKECVESGIEEILFITNSNKKCVEDYFDKNYELESRLLQNNKIKELDMIKDIHNMCKIYYIRQSEPNGSADAIKLASSFVGSDDFAILLGDDLMKYETPVLEQLIKMYEKYDANIIGVHEVEEDLKSRYGIVEVKDDKIIKMIEKPNPSETSSNIAIAGRYIVKNKIFKEIDKLNRGKNGEYQFTDALLNLMGYQDFYACKFNGTYFDIGSKMGYIKAILSYALDSDLHDSVEEYLKELI